MTTKQKTDTFETSLERLESLVNKMEAGDATLEQSLTWFEEGMALIKSCQTQLTEAEQKVSELMNQSTPETSQETGE